MKAKYVFFDCWNTVIRYVEHEKNGDVKALLPYLEGPDLTVERLAAALKEIERQYYSQNQWDISAQALLALWLESAGCRLKISYAEGERLIAGNFLPTDPIPGVEDFLSKLEERHIPCAILSNTTLSEDITRECVEKTLTYRPFKFVLASSRVGAKKPNPLFFRLGAVKAGVDPHDAVYIGDSFSADVYGSSLAGMKPVWLNWKKAQPIENLNVTDYLEVESYAELCTVLEEKL